MLGTYHSSSLFDILKEIHFLYEPSKLWNFVLKQACTALQAEAGTFFELSADGTKLHVTATYGIDVTRLGELDFPVGGGISGWVAQYNQPALVNDVRSDTRFNRKVDLVTGFQTKSILCVPIFSQKQSYGVLEVLNRKNNQFSPQDQEFMTVLGRQTAVAYQNLVLFNEVARTKTLLESVLENLSGGLIAVDTGGLILIVNPAASRLLQLPESTPGKPADVVLQEYPDVLRILHDTVQKKSTVSRAEMALPIKGEATRIGYTTLLISDRQKTLLGSGIIFQKL